MTNKVKHFFRIVAGILTMILTVNLTEPAAIGKVYATEGPIFESEQDIEVTTENIEEQVETVSENESETVSENAQDEAVQEETVQEEVPEDVSENENEVVETESEVVEDTPIERESSLEDFEIVDGVLVSYIGSDEIVEVPDSVTTIGEAAFSNNTTMTKLYLGKNVVSIESYIVRGCTALTTISLPDGDTAVDVDNYAFSGCSSITTVELLETVVSVDEVFLNLSTLQQFNVASESTYYYADQGVLYYRDSATNDLQLVRMPKASTVTDYTIPSDRYVKEICEDAFGYCANLTSITVADGITTIGAEAFYGCRALETAVMGKDVVTLGNYIFGSCSALESLTISESLMDGTVGYSLVSGCSSLTTLIVPAAAQYVPKDIWAHSALQEINVEENGIYYFSDNGVLYQKKAVENTESTRQVLVAYPRSKESGAYSILAGTEAIGECAFSYCDNLTEIIMPDSLEEIGYEAFYDCDSLTDVVMGKNVSTLSNYIFSSCNGMTSLTLPEKITESTTEYSLISSCNLLTTINVPAGAQYVPKDIWSHSYLTEIIVEEGNTKYFSDNGVLYETESVASEEGTGDGEATYQVLVAYPRSKGTGSYSILSGTKAIGEYAFSYCDNLTEIIMPDSLLEIRYEAFYDCDGLTDVVIGKNVSTLSNYIFSSCNGMTSLTLPEKITESTTGYSLISSCNLLTTINVPAGAQYVPKDIWSHSYLTEIIVEEGNTKYFSDNGVLYELEIVEPEEGSNEEESTYQVLVAYPRSKETGSYNILSGTKAIGEYAFSYCDNLTEIIMPDSLLEIRYEAFYDCDSLTDVVMGKNVTTLSNYIFSSCNGLTSLTLSEKLTEDTVGYSMVSSCNLLTTIYVPEATLYVPNDIIQHRYLRNIYVIDAEGKKNVEGDVYSSADGILYSADKTSLVRVPTKNSTTEYVIPESVTRIEKQAAYYNEMLTAVTLPADVDYIGNSAFEYCVALQLIMATGCNPTTIESYALDANDTVVIMCDADTSIVDHAVNYGLIYMCGENIITVTVRKQLTGENVVEEDSLRNYGVTVYLGENAGNDDYEFDAYSAGEYVLLPTGRSASNGDSIDEYDTVTLVLKSKSGECADCTYVVELDENKNATVEIETIQRGYVTGTVETTTLYTVSLYDEEGNYVDKLSNTEGGYRSEYLPAGNYSIVALQGKLRNWIQDTLTDYTEIGMTADVDYVLKNITVTDGEITTANVVMPEESNYASQWIDSEKTKYGLANDEITAGGLMNFRLEYSLKEERLDYNLSGKYINITIPENVTVYMDTVMIDGEFTGNADLNNGILSIYVTGNSGTIQFTGMPVAYGDILSTATMEFSYGGEAYEEYLGSISTTMEYITIHVQSNTPLRNILVHGVTVPGSEVTIYDNGAIIGTATAYKSGKWSARVDLADSAMGTLHRVGASVTVNGVVKSTREYEIIYADTMITLSGFKVIHNNQVYLGDASGTMTPGAITFNPNDGFTFVVDIANAQDIEQVYITTEVDDGEVRVPATRVQSAGTASSNVAAGVSTASAAARSSTGSWVAHGNFAAGIGTVTTIRIRRGDSSRGSVVPAPTALSHGTPPKVLYIEYVMKDVNEAVEQAVIERYNNLTESDVALEKSEMPDMWKNATADINSDTRDAQGYGTIDFDINLDNEEQTTLNYRITSERNITVSTAELEADADYTKTFDENGRAVFTKYYYQETYIPGTDTGEVRAMSDVGTTRMEMGAKTYVLNDYEKGIADAFTTEIVGNVIGDVSKTAGGVATVAGVYTDIIEVGNNFVSIVNARAAINGSNLSAAEKAARNAALDNVIMGYMICAGLRYAAVVVAAAAAFSGAPLMAGLAIAGIISVMNTFVNKSLKDALDKLTSFDRIIWLIDPSGYVYEAVEDNRIQGATAQVYYKDDSDNPVLWNAEEYGQINPQITDAEGKFAWDVPEGLWKVEVSKEGYENTESGWLPVPPVQTDVNLGLISTAKPEVAGVYLYQNTAVVEFSQYMKVSTVTADKFEMNSDAVISAVSALDAKPDATDADVLLAKKFRVAYTCAGTVSELTVASSVENYVGATMEGSATEENLVVIYEVEELQGEDSLAINFGEQGQYALKILPAEASGNAISYEVSNTNTLEVISISDADAEGTRIVTVNGILPTKAYIDFYAEGSVASKKIEVKVSTQEMLDLENQGTGDGEDENQGTGDGEDENQGTGDGDDNKDVYTVSFESGCDTVYEHVRVNAGEVIEEPQKPERTGYAFGGWFTDGKYEYQWNFDTDVVTGDMTLYAAWFILAGDGEMTITAVEDQIYTGNAVKPNIVVRDENRILTEGKDYKVTYKNNKKVNAVKVIGSGTEGDFNSKLPTIIITGKGDYTKKISMNFNIIAKPLTDAEIAVGIEEAYSYTGKNLKIETVSYNKKKLKANTDYTIAYYPMEDYLLAEKDVRRLETEFASHKADKIKEVGEYVAIVKGIGNFGGIVVKEFGVYNRISLNKATLKLSKSGKSKQYTGSAVELDYSEITMKIKGKTINLSELGNVDGGFDVLYTNNTAVGKATITIKADENNTEYIGSKSATFTIKGTAIKKAAIEDFKTEYTYTGTAIKQTELKLKSPEGAYLVENTHYKVDYRQNINAGKATVIITGMPEGGYTGTVKKTFKIKKRNLNETTDLTGDVEVTYSKVAKKPQPILIYNDMELVAGKDYKISYKNTGKVADKSVEKAPTMVIKGTGNYEGSKNISYSIVQKDITDSEINITVPDMAKTSKKFEPKVTVKDGTKKLAKGKDYTVEYYNSQAADVAEGKVPYLIIAGTGNYKGTTENIEIHTYSTKISKAKFFKVENDEEKEIGNVFYTGTPHTPEIIVKYDVDGDGTLDVLKPYDSATKEGDYLVLGYGENTKVGVKKATITVKGMGEFGDTVVIKFTILPKWLKWFIRE